MVTAIEVANYFLWNNRESQKFIPDKFKIQILVYYAQAWNITFWNKSLFDEVIEAGVNGPIIPSVWNYLNQINSKYLEDIDIANFTKSELYVLEEVERVYGNLNPEQLINLTLSEVPIECARIDIKAKESSQEPILFNEMVDFYKNFCDKKSKNPKILNIAIDPNKEIFVTAEFKDGTTKEIRQSDIVDFVIENKDKLATKQMKPRRKPIIPLSS